MADQSGQMSRRYRLAATGLAVVAVFSVVPDMSALAAAPNSLSLRATYVAQARISWANRSLRVTSTATVRNTTGTAVRKLTFNLLPLETGRARVREVRVGGRRVRPSARGQSLLVPLAVPLASGHRARVTITYDATFNALEGSKRALFVMTDRAMTAYRWIPWLSRVQPFEAPNFGETWVTSTSPRVTVQLSSDMPVRFATAGRRLRATGKTQTFVATNVRDFNFSASPDYRVRRVTANGVRIRVYYLDLSPGSMIEPAIGALERFTDKLGAYPYRTLTLAETPMGSGMESPGLTWISSSVGEAWLPYVVVHELAHQWFHGVVGNNQAANPFVDEALAEFLARTFSNSFRPSRCPKTRLDLTVYEYSARCYGEVVYVQGSRYLRSYRAEVGSAAFWAGLRTFYRENRFGIVGTRALLDALDEASGFDSRRHAERFPSLYP